MKENNKTVLFITREKKERNLKPLKVTYNNAIFFGLMRGKERISWNLTLVISSVHKNKKIEQNLEC